MNRSCKLAGIRRMEDSSGIIGMRLERNGFGRRSVRVAMLLLCIMISRAFAQPEDRIPDDVEERIERAVGQYESDGSGEADPIDELEEYRRRPIDLYTTTADVLARLPGISRTDAKAILEFIDRASPADFAELNAIETLGDDQIDILRTFTSLHPPRKPRSPKRFRLEIRSRFTQDLQPRRGYGDELRRIVPRLSAIGDSIGIDTIPLGSSYLGSRAGYLTRIIASYGDFSGGITFEKDPGEPLFFRDTASLGYGQLEYVDPRTIPGESHERIGFFLGAHASARLGPVSLYLGDYTAEFGQGLLLRNRLGGSKGAEVTRGPYNPGRGIASYRSPGEIDFHRGGALVFEEGGWLPDGMRAGIFASYRSLDASLSASEDAPATVTSIREDGYRRTRGEIRRSGNLDERLLGVNLRHRFARGAIGLTAYNARFSIPFSGDLPDDFRGDAATMVSIDGEYSIGESTLFGEMARDHDGTYGAIGGMMTMIEGMELAAAGRYLPASFQTLHGAGFGESPKQQRNERGIYIGAKMPVATGIILSTYFDLYDHPEGTPVVPFPRSGVDGFLQLDYAPSRNITIHARLRSETKDDAFTIADTFERARKRIVDRSSTSGRIEASYLSTGGAFRLRGRFERRHVSYGSALPASDGILTFIDLRQTLTSAISLGMRFVLFDTDNHDAAIYELEQDIPGRLTNLALSGEGRRYYIYLRWHSPTLSLAARYAETVHADRSTISPGGPQQISGRVNNVVAVQIDLRF